MSISQASETAPWFHERLQVPEVCRAVQSLIPKQIRSRNIILLCVLWPEFIRKAVIPVNLQIFVEDAVAVVRTGIWFKITAVTEETK